MATKKDVARTKPVTLPTIKIPLRLAQLHEDLGVASALTHLPIYALIEKAWNSYDWKHHLLGKPSDPEKDRSTEPPKGPIPVPTKSPVLFSEKEINVARAAIENLAGIIERAATRANQLSNARSDQPGRTGGSTPTEDDDPHVT